MPGPGSASRVSPEDRKRLAGPIRKFMKSKHPFRACMRALQGKPGITNPEGVCGVLKALGKRGAAVKEGEEDAFVEQVLTELEEAGLTEELVPALEMYLAVEAAEMEMADGLSEATAADGPVVEAATRVIIPEKGKLFADDGTCRVAVIRPCVSQGRRLRGLPPIYTPKMLAEHAAVFTGWHMFMDHLTEEMIEAVRRRNRSIRELGGRMVKSWWDPDLRTAEDDERGFKPGGIVGLALPQPPVRSMLEADPEILRCSINAWPTSAVEGEMWGQRGMLIEGIRSKPRGSVDWVLRDGAGGRPLAEDEQLAVSLLERFYDAGQGAHVSGTQTTKPLNEMSVDELMEHLKGNAGQTFDQLAERLKGSGGGTGTGEPKPKPEKEEPEPLTEEAVKALIEADRKKAGEEAEAKARALVESRESARTNAETAREMIRKASGLTPGFRQQLLERYTLLPSGEPPALLLSEDLKEGEAVKEPAADVFKKRVQEDIDHAVNLVREAQGKPAVKGQGAARTGEQAPGKDGKVTEGDPDKGKGRPAPRTAFRDFMLESGGFDKPEDVDKVFEEVTG